VAMACIKPSVRDLLKEFLARVGSCGMLSRSVLGLPREPSPQQEWAARYEEDAVEQDLAIVDAHHHFFDFPHHEKGILSKSAIRVVFSLHPRLTNKLFVQDPVLANTYGARSPFVAKFTGPELAKDVNGPGEGRGHRVVDTVYMECGWKTPGVPKWQEPVGEVDMVMEERRRYPQCCGGIVAFADLSLGAEVEETLRHYKQNPLVKGIRFGLAWSSDPMVSSDARVSKDTAYDPKFREGFALLSKHGFTFDSWLYHENIQAFMDLAGAFPEQTMILDHVGFPLGIGSYKRSEMFPIWQNQMKELAAHRNVCVKLGGFGMRLMGFGFDERPKPPSSDELAEAWGPYIRHAVETFGVDRCIMESNFPMDKISCSYTVLWNAYKKALAGYSRADKEKLFELNAKRVYRLA